jgi:hypothetical protein
MTEDTCAKALTAAPDATAVVPRSIGAALTSLKLMERELTSAKTYQQITRIVDIAKSAKILHREVREVREQAAGCCSQCRPMGRRKF